MTEREQASVGQSDSRPYGGAGVAVADGAVGLTVRLPDAELLVNLHPDDAEALAALLRDAAKEVRGAQ